MTAPEKILYDPEHPELKLPELLYKKYAPRFLSVCIRYCGNVEDAEDVLHDGFIKILKNITKYKDVNGGSFEGWMKRIIINTALNHLRDHAKEKRFLDIEPLSEKISEPEESETYFDNLAGKIKQEKVMEMVCGLPPGYRAVFNLYVFESYSHREIAGLLGCSENTSKSQLSKARGMLRNKLDQHYFKQLETNGNATKQT
jgi:RNA polymerase sigma-70 factor (ECF subfamily)